MKMTAWSCRCALVVTGLLVLGGVLVPMACGQDAKEQTKAIEDMYKDYKRSFAEVPDVEPVELMVDADKKVLFVDVRSPEEQAVSMIPGAITQKEFERDAEQYRLRRVVTYCTIGYRSGLYAKDLRKEGWDAHNLRGSILAWVHDGGELVNGAGKTRKVHVYGPKWDLLPAGYEAVVFGDERDLAETPAVYLKRQPKPVFRTGHTLPPLTRYGWTLPFDARVELAENWGYTLEFGGYVTEKSVKNLADPDSSESRLVRLAAEKPDVYKHCSTGWAGTQNMLMMALNARGFEIANGSPYCYDWLCAGWPRDKGLGADEKLTDKGLGDLDRYAGFLKCMYTAGMLGGNAGYYAYPEGGFGAKFDPEHPPHWLLQMIVFARVHALFSHLESDLRASDLLPGPDRHVWSKDQPAYSFPCGDETAHVLARKVREASRWLIAAWAAAGDDRTVTVTIPELGEVSVEVRATGSVYRAVPGSEEGSAKLERLDPDGRQPTAHLRKERNAHG